MSWRRSLLTAAIAVLTFVSVIVNVTAQETTSAASPGPAQPLTRAQQLEKWGLYEDPGSNPDPETIYIRFGQKFRIARFEKKWAVMETGREGWIRPQRGVNYVAELYAQNDQHVWVFIPVREKEPEQAEAAPAVDLEEIGGVKSSDGRYRLNQMPRPVSPEVMKYYEELRPEFELVTPPDAGVTIGFVEASEGLPENGSWRNSLDIADMNGDGHMDIVTPPQRGGAASLRPHIFLGDGKGNWRSWSQARWPRSINYGSVDAGDLNRDGHQDVVFGVHLTGVAAFLGDGKGNFTDASKGLPKNFPTRRANLTDIDGDGDLDIIAISEGPTLHEQEGRAGGSPIRAYINEGKAKSWREVAIAEPVRTIAGDWLATGDLNGDKRIDIVGSTTYFQAPDIIYLNEGRGKWTPFGRGWLPFRAYYGGVTVGRFSSTKRDDAIVASVKRWSGTLDPQQVPPPQSVRVQAIERITWENGAARRIPIARWPSERFLTAIGSGDVNGDGKLDVVYREPALKQFGVLLGDGKGNFKRADVAGLTTPANTAYDLRVEDVNGDGLDDIAIMYESRETTGKKDGSVKLFLSRGVQKKTE